MKLVVESVSISELKKMANSMYGTLVKGVVDIDKELLVLDAELHADEEAFLIEKGSSQSSLWGINLYPERYGMEDYIEFDSMINIRPSQKNMSRSVESEQIRKKIIELVNRKVQP